MHLSAQVPYPSGCHRLASSSHRIFRMAEWLSRSFFKLEHKLRAISDCLVVRSYSYFIQDDAH